MGEYAIYKDESIKIGTCDAMYYLRWDQRTLVRPEEGNVNPAWDRGLFWRLPVPEEDGIEPGGFNYPPPTSPLYRKNPWKPEAPETQYWRPAEYAAPGFIQTTHPCGLLVNVTCYHGEKLPEGNPDFRPHWNGKYPGFWELAYTKNPTDGPMVPVTKCRACGAMVRTTWDEILDYVPDMVLRERLRAMSTD